MSKNNLNFVYVVTKQQKTEISIAAIFTTYEGAETFMQQIIDLENEDDRIGHSGRWYRRDVFPEADIECGPGERYFLRIEEAQLYHE